MSRLNSRKTCYYSIQNLLTSVCCQKKINTKRIIIMPAVSYWCDIWSLILTLQSGKHLNPFRSSMREQYLTEKYRLRVFDKLVLREEFVPRRKK